MPKVFVIESLRRSVDLSKADSFGEIVYVFPRGFRRCGVFRHIEFGQTVLNRLHDLGFNSDEDFICIVGSMITVSIALVAIAQTHDVFKVLLFNSSDEMYIEKRFDSNDWIK